MILEIDLPGYDVKEKPDWESLGEKIDVAIRKNFSGRIAVRCLGVKDHPGKTVDEMIELIRQLGTDRYDPKRVGNGYENVENRKIDIFALDYDIKEDTKIMDNMIKSFYVYPIEDGQDPVRIDIVLIYDCSKLKNVPHTYKGREDVKIDGFIFTGDPKDALLGIIKVT